jgi:hypothetical protein
MVDRTERHHRESTSSSTVVDRPVVGMGTIEGETPRRYKGKNQVSYRPRTNQLLFSRPCND